MRMYVKLTLFQLHAILLWKTRSLIETQVLLKLSKSGEAPEVERTKKLLKQRENFWILKLETLKPTVLNPELNK